MPPDVAVFPDPDGAFPGEFRGPREFRILEAVIENEQLPPLLQRGARLDQRPRRLAGLDDDGRLGEGRHRDVALREEKPVSLRALPGMTPDGNLADQQMPGGDPLLEFRVLFRIGPGYRRSHHPYRPAARVDRRGVRGRIDPFGQSRNDREIVGDELPDQTARARDPFR